MDNQRAIQLLQAHIDAEDMPLFSQVAAIGIRAIERVATLEAELAEARKDGEQYRANWLALLNATGQDCHLRALDMITAARAAEGGKG